MEEILAAVTDHDADHRVDGFATAVAKLTNAQVRHLELGVPESRKQAIARVLHETAAPEVVLTVLSRDVPTPPIWPGVIPQVSKPVILVPYTGLPLTLSRALVPLDGTPESTGAVAGVMDLFARAGLDLVVLHVFNAATAPRFWDQAAHARREWEEEFMARYCSAPGARLTLRSGAPDEQVVDVATEEHADLITLGWSQRLASGRAQTVRRTIADSLVPVMLVPLGSA
ncbi:MAG TPA: universal stress protein [Jiangellaceae bacterium]